MSDQRDASASFVKVHLAKGQPIPPLEPSEPPTTNTTMFSSRC